uniref:Uncharacterized protein n=1 Tax=Meloidogyne hapla TaxID=6305 RepID=A0A1I8B5E0_MELHA
MRILKFIINKFEQKLKFTIGCKMQKIRSKFEIKEFNDHYESFYDQKHVCPNDKYIIKIENYSNILEIPLDCEETINEGRYENKYLINVWKDFNWIESPNKSKFFSYCKISNEVPRLITDIMINNDQMCTNLDLLFADNIYYKTDREALRIGQSSNDNIYKNVDQKTENIKNKGKASILNLSKEMDNSSGSKRKNEFLEKK